MKKSVLFFTILFTGCASVEPVNFSHPHGNQQQYQTDAKQCEYEAIKHAQVADPRYGVMYGQIDLVQRQRDLSIMCMEARGYTIVTKEQQAILRQRMGQ
jgi:hypothetical protein